MSLKKLLSNISHAYRIHHVLSDSIRNFYNLSYQDERADFRGPHHDKIRQSLKIYSQRIERVSSLNSWTRKYAEFLDGYHAARASDLN